MSFMTGALHKIKRPHGPFTYQFASSETDSSGHWLSLPRGAQWTAPHDSGLLPFDVVVLLVPNSPLVTWWCDRPTGRRLEVDVCLPPTEADGDWSFIDLELDVYRYADGSVTVEDEDEFMDACRAGHISTGDAGIAEAACSEAVTQLRAAQPPFDQSGWNRLDALSSSGR